MSPTRQRARSGGMRAFAHAPLLRGSRGPGGDRRAGLVAVGLTVVLVLPLAAVTGTALAHSGARATPPQEAQDAKLRAKDLGVVEHLLVQAVQEAVNERIRTINDEVRRSQVEARQTGEPPEYQYQFRSSGEAGARGLFLEDYGAIFTVQVPHVSYAPTRALLISTSNGDVPLFVGDRGTDAVVALQQARELQIRSQLNVLQRSLAQIEGMLQEEARSEETASLASQMSSRIAELEELQSRLADELRAQERSLRTARADDARREAEAREAAGAEQPERRAVAAETVWSRIVGDPEENARARERADEQERQIEEAVLTGIIDTLAQYGTVIHGLDEDDRLAVVLQPSSYLSDVQRWLRATDRAEEFVVSVRYGDIAELEEGDIDAEEFGQRIRIESRLGQPRPAVRPPDSR